MPTFAEEFDGKFRDAHERVSQRPNHQKLHERTTDPSALASSKEVSIDDFHAYMPMHAYIFIPTGELWPASSIDSRLPRQRLVGGNGLLIGESKTVKASRWLDKYKPIEQMTWAPGEPKIIDGRIVSEGGWIERPGCRVFNLSR